MSKIKEKTFLPTTWKGWVSLFGVVIIALQPILLLVGMYTGRIGYTLVEGNSMSRVFPWGSLIVILPLRPQEGDYVVARTWGGMDTASEKADIEPSFVVKRLVKGRLISTDSPDTYSHDFQIRGVVVCCLPIQKVIRCLDKGAQKPIFVMSDKERLEAISALNRRELAHKNALAAKGLVEYVPSISVANGSRLSEGAWSDPRVIPERAVDIDGTYIEFVVEKQSWIELTLGPVPPTTTTVDGKAAMIETGWLQPGKYRLTWSYEKGACSDTPSCSFKFYCKQ